MLIERSSVPFHSQTVACSPVSAVLVHNSFWTRPGLSREWGESQNHTCEKVNGANKNVAVAPTVAPAFVPVGITACRRLFSTHFANILSTLWSHTGDVIPLGATAVYVYIAIVLRGRGTHPSALRRRRCILP
jgi:hypothetical protein